MNHSTYIDTFRQMAGDHKEIRHDKAFAPGNSPKRSSFFRSEAEYTDAISSSKAGWPCMIVQDYNGSLEGEAEIRDAMTGSFEIRDHAKDTASMEEVETIKQRCKDIAFVFVQELIRLSEERNSPVPGFDPAGVSYIFTGPTAANDYGCRISFRMRDEAFDQYGYDRADHFND